MCFVWIMRGWWYLWVVGCGFGLLPGVAIWCFVAASRCGVVLDCLWVFVAMRLECGVLGLFSFVGFFGWLGWW